MTDDDRTTRRPAPGIRRIPAPPAPLAPPIPPTSATSPEPPPTPAAPADPAPLISPAPPITSEPVAPVAPVVFAEPGPIPPVGVGTTHHGAAPEAYSSSVVAPMQIVLGVGSGALVAVFLTAIRADLWPIGVLLFLLASAVGVYLAPVSVSVESQRVTIWQGRRERDPLVVYVAEVREAGLRNVTWAQCLGFGGVESDDRTTRLAVRPGVTLVLTIFDGSRILVSVTDGPAALRAIEAAAPPVR